MIVRINQLDAHQAEQHGGWPADGLAGPIDCAWPADMLAFELLILAADEQNQPLSRPFRQSQLRQLIPDVLDAMRQPQDAIVLRLDGALAVGEIVDAFKYLSDERGYGRFCTSPTEKFAEEPQFPNQSIRLNVTASRLAALCADPNVGLERSVRLRAFCVSEELVNPLLDISDPSDERWKYVLSQASVILSTTRALQSVQLFTRLLSPEETRSRLTDRLLAGVRSS